MKILFVPLLFSYMALALPLAKRSITGYTSGNTANDVTNGVCAPLTVIFARGTGESGNIGSVIGPPLFQALSTALNKNVALQGVVYAADFAGDVDGGAEGGPPMAKLAQQALKQCPTTKVALAGYSQGGLVIHYALNQAGLSSSSVSAITYFGDPGEHLSISIMTGLTCLLTRLY
jgi:cutinase